MKNYMHNRRKFIAQSSLALGAFTFLRPFKSIAATKSATKGRTLTILYTNGLAGQWNGVNGTAGLRGIKQAVAGVRREQEQILLVDAGNLLAINSAKNIGHLRYFEAIKETGYDALTPGQADLQHGPAYYAKLVEKSKVRAVDMNAADDIDSSVLTYRIVRKGELKIGIIGIGSCANISAASFPLLLQSMNRYAEKLKQQHHCQLVVCLSHLPLATGSNTPDSMELAKKSSAVDVVISANDERFIYNTHVVKNTQGEDVLVSHAGKEGLMLGRLDIAFNEAYLKTSIVARQMFTGVKEKDQTTAFRTHAALQLA